MNEAEFRKIPRDPRAVFVAMPLNDTTSEELFSIVEYVCKQGGLRTIRADRFRKPGLITRDIREAIDGAGIVVADLTGLNPNVLYEVGVANANFDRVIILHKRGEILPFDLAGQRAISYSLLADDDRESLHQELWAALKEMKPPIVPSVIEGKLARSRSALEDLQRLLEFPAKRLTNECVWFSGFLSTLAIDEKEKFANDETEYRDALLQDKRLLIELARKGCPVRLIISPPHPGRIDDAMAEGRETTVQRLQTLLAFLNNADEPGLERMEFAISPFRQKHLYIVGHISVSEGFKIKLERGYDLTLRHEHPNAISASIAAQEILFSHLKRCTLSTYGGPNAKESWATLLKCTILAIQTSLETVQKVGPWPSASNAVFAS